MLFESDGNFFILTWLFIKMILQFNWQYGDSNLKTLWIQEMPKVTLMLVLF